MVPSCIRPLLIAAMTVAVMALDTIDVTAPQPKADENGLIPALVEFHRQNADGPLMILYRVSGTGVSDLHGGQVAAAAVSSRGAGYLSSRMSPVVVTGSSPISTGTATAAQPTLTVTSDGGRVAAVAVTYGGTGYAAAETPTVTIGGTGSGATATAAVAGSLASVSVASGSGGQNYVLGDILTFTDGAPTVAARVRIDAVDASGAVTAVSVERAGSGYQAAPSTLSGGAGSGFVPTVTMDYQVSNITVTSQGTGYITATVTVAAPASGLGAAATATATVVGSQLHADGVSVVSGGYGLSVPAATVSGAGSGAVVRPVIFSGAVERFVVEDGGAGYATPVVTIPGGTTPATASTTVVGGVVTQAVLMAQGAGYADGTHTASVSDGSAVAAFSAVAVGGRIISIQVTSGGTGFPVPTVTLPAPVGGTAASGTATISGGRITSVSVAAAGAGFGLADAAINDLNTAAETMGTVSFQVAGSDYYVIPQGVQAGGRASMGVWVDTASGDLLGSITFAAGEKTVGIQVVPMRNGVGGGRDLQVSIEPAAGYNVDQTSTAEVRIGDVDDVASISVLTPVAYPVPTTISQDAYPTEVDGRAETRIDLTGDDRSRRYTVQFTGDGTLQRAAIGQDEDCLVVFNRISIPETVDYYLIAANKERQAPFDEGPSGAGDTEIYVQSIAATWLRAGTVVMFEGAGVDTRVSGIYVVTGLNPGDSTTNPSITISPALHDADCVANSTRIRFLGWDAFYGATAASDPDSTLIHDLYVSWDTLYYFAFPYQRSAPRGARSLVAKLTETDDYAVRSPATAKMTVADTSVIARVRHGGDAGQPSTAGSVVVSLSSAFPVDVTVPFTVLSSSTAQLTIADDPNTTANEYQQNHVTVDGVDASTRRGEVIIPAGSTSKTIWITPSGNATETASRVVDVRLDASYDYQFGPQGTSQANTMASVTVSPMQLTAYGRPLRVAFDATRTVAAAEPSTDGSAVIVLVDENGAPLTDSDSVLTPVAVAYSATGTAVASVNYQALSGIATIPAGSKSVIIPVRIQDDNVVTQDLSLVLTLVGGTGYQVTGTANAAVAVRDGGSRLSVAVTGGAVRPGSRAGTNGVFTITNSRPSSQSVTVTYGITGSAVAGTDFTALTGFVTFPPGATSVPVEVIPLAGDGSATSLTLALAASSVPAQYLLESPVQATMNIAAPLAPVQPSTADGRTAYVAVARVQDGSERGLTQGLFRIYLSDAAGAALAGAGGVLATDLTVTYTASGTALAAVNYQALTGVAVIPAGQPSVDVPVQILNDSVVGDTVLTLTLPSANWPSAVSSASLTIVDGSPLVTVTSSASPLIQGGTATGSFTVTLDAAQTANLTVQYSLGGTAVAGQDYVALSGSVVVLAGQTSAVIPVIPTDLRLSTTEPRLVLTVTAETGTRSYGLGSAVQAAVTIRAPYTSQGESVSIGVQSRRDATEAGITGILRFYLASSAGAPLGGTLTQAVPVGYSVSGSAVPAVNYQRLTGVAVIPAGQPYVDVPVSALNDNIAGTRLTVSATINDGAWYGVSGQASAVVVIGDGALPTVHVSSLAGYTTAYQGGTPGYILVYADAVQAAPLSVRYAVGGTAVADADYAALSGTVTIPTGASYAAIPVAALTGTLSRTAPVVTITLLDPALSTPTYQRGTAVEGSVTISAPVDTTPTPRVVAGSGGSSGGCGAGSGIGVVLAGAGLALTTLRRRRRRV